MTSGDPPEHFERASTVAQALAAARAAGLDKLDAELLLLLALGFANDALSGARSWLLTHDTDRVAGPVLHRYRQWVRQRLAGEPLAYIVGSKDFYAMALRVDPHVLVPRPDTETLVDWALQWLSGRTRPTVLDLGTGSGAIAIAVAHARPDAIVTATDLDAAALAVARANAHTHGVVLECLLGSWWTPLGGRRFDLVLSNPPYIAADDTHLAALGHEPQHALTPGGDGLDALRTLAAGAALHLQPTGAVILEHGFDQAAAVRTLLHGAGLVAAQTRTDLGGQDRCTGACRAG